MTNPTFSQLTYATGTAGSTAITFNAGSYDFSQRQKVTLSTHYVRTIPAGFPNADAGALASGDPTAYAQTIASGAVVALYVPEAAAIVAAGAGTNTGSAY